MTETERVYEGSRIFLENYDYVMNNVYMFDWESDLFGISKSGLTVEIEVKISRSDFLADFKKIKHTLFESLHKKEEISTITPNRFYFSCIESVINESDVPDYAGLIWCDKRYSNYHVVKKAPLLHKERNEFTDKLLSKYYHTSINTRHRINILLHRMRSKPFCEADVTKEIKSILRLLK